MDEKGEEVDEQVKNCDDFGRTMDDFLICKEECQRSCVRKFCKEDGFLKRRHVSEE